MRVRVLTLSNLYPNPVQPRKGVFVKERVRHVESTGEVDTTVIAPVPWFPFKNKRFGQYGEFARVGRISDDGTRQVHHPRFFLLPKIGAAFAPRTYAASVLRTIVREKLGPFDLIDAHFMFPDAAAAVIVGKSLGLPVVVTARGSDLNIMPQDRFAGPWIRRTLRACDAAVGVSAALGKKLLTLGCHAEKMHVLRNGVDQNRFTILDREACRLRLGFTGPLALCVGNLVPVKGQELAVQALAYLEDVTLLLVGRGPSEPMLRRAAQDLGVADRVHFVPEVTQDELVAYYNAADVLLLPSIAEGMPNVVLESMACGTPVVAAGVGGVPEILGQSKTGKIVFERDAKQLANAVQHVLQDAPMPDAVRAEIAAFDWGLTATRIRSLFQGLITANRATAKATDAKTDH